MIRKVGAQALVVVALAGVSAKSVAEEDNALQIVIIGTRLEQSAFDLPMSIDRVEQNQIQEQRLQVNVSENLARVPGAVVQNRENYSQEQQLTLRGFGARSTFGVRGIKLIADGIPASTPDGQGGTALFGLGSADRIEVLRGPFSALYGNHSGGVVQIFTEDGPDEPTGTTSAALGSFSTHRYGAKLGGEAGALNYVADISSFRTGGYREHSSASREQLNSKLRWTLDDGAKLTFVANVFDQPESEDPLGLTAAQVQENRRQADVSAFTFNTRRSLENAQTGLVYERPLSDSDTLRLLGYLGQRSNEQYLAIPLAVQSGPLHSGGVSTVARDFGGFGSRWTRRTGDEAPTTLTMGVDYDRADDSRQGFLNVNGVKGDLKRNERNEVATWGVYVQAERWVTPDWSLSGGLRYTAVNFTSEDRFVTATNPDDSGGAHYRAWTPVAGVLYRVGPALNLYANVGRSFETPTFVELAYRPDGASGLNFDLRPTISNHYEAGLKTVMGTSTRINLALFAIDSENEIVVFSNTGGRATFQNAPGSKREGVELAIDSRLGAAVTAYLSYSYIDARFSDSFLTCSGNCATPNATVASGNRIPGVPRHTIYGELVWKRAASGFSSAIEARWQDDTYVDDLNSEYASSYVIINVRGGFEQRVEKWRLKQFVRVDNVLNKRYIGAVVVNDANGRFYAPAAERNYLIGASFSREF